MPGTYSQILLHVVFSTKGWAAFIQPEIEARLYDYIGGMPDHVHLLLRWRTDRAIADLMRTVKSRSSRWVHQTFADAATFAWQEGYGAFTVSRSNLDDVARYIAGQDRHHGTMTFEEELLALFERHGIDYDPEHALG